MHALDDITVLDFSQLVSGPTCTQWLATFGADVIKVEPPSGGSGRTGVNGSYMAAFNLGGKRSIGLDLKTAEGQAIAEEIARTADVIVENFRPGVLERFDLGYEDVIESNPDIVYCSISGFGQSGPYSDRPSLDSIAQAHGGVIDITGYADGPATRIGTTGVDISTGLLGALMVCAGLRQRDLTGEGEYIDVSLFDTALSWMAFWVSEYASTGEVPTRTGDTMSGEGGGQGLFPADGKDWRHSDELIYLFARTDARFTEVCRAIDREDIAQDERFSTREARSEHTGELKEELGKAFAAYGWDESVKALADAGIPTGKVQDVAEIVDHDPQVAALDSITETYNYHRDTESKTVRPPFRTKDGAPDVGDRPPAFGEHTRDILADYGYSDDRVEELIEREVVFETTPETSP